MSKKERRKVRQKANKQKAGAQKQNPDLIDVAGATDMSFGGSSVSGAANAGEMKKKMAKKERRKERQRANRKKGPIEDLKSAKPAVVYRVSCIIGVSTRNFLNSRDDIAFQNRKQKSILYRPP